MKICLKGNEFNPSFAGLYGEEEAIKQGYTVVEVADIYDDCSFEDFDGCVFNVDKYNTRKLQEENQKSIPIIQARLDKLTQDFIQVLCGAVIDDIEERKQEFQTLHNELRVLLGKEPRIYE